MDPMWYPRGVMPGDVCDPDVLFDEFIRAAQVAGNTTQWQWLQGAFTDVNKLKRGPPVQFSSCGTSAVMGTLPGTAPILPDTGGADPNLWKVPYMRGLERVAAGATGDMLIQWTSVYPELVIGLYSMQYVRGDTSVGAWTTFFTVGRIPRVQSAIAFDGAAVPGTGPGAIPVDNRYRGQGLATKACPLAAMTVTFLPPGAHSFEVLAGQASALNSDDTGSEAATYGDAGPTERVCVGSRFGAVLRLSFGAGLGA